MHRTTIKKNSREKGNYQFRHGGITKGYKKLADEVVDIKKNNNDNNQNRGYFRPPFRRYFQNKPPTPPLECLNVDEVANVLKALMSNPDKRDDQQSEVFFDDVPQEEIEEDVSEDPLGETINHFTNIFDEEEEEVGEVKFSQHPYNTRSWPSQSIDSPSTSNQVKNSPNLKIFSNDKEPILLLEYEII